MSLMYDGSSNKKNNFKLQVSRTPLSFENSLLYLFLLSLGVNASESCITEPQKFCVFIVWCLYDALYSSLGKLLLGENMSYSI